jgi:hypothetical protein
MLSLSKPSNPWAFTSSPQHINVMKTLATLAEIRRTTPWRATEATVSVQTIRGGKVLFLR